jgi:hypothetical protein
MAIVYIDKCRYEIQEQKNVLVWYTSIYQPTSSTTNTQKCMQVNRKNMIPVVKVTINTFFLYTNLTFCGRI